MLSESVIVSRFICR